MTTAKAREYINAARLDMEAAWDEQGNSPTEEAVPYLLAAVTEAILALTEAVLADNRDDDESKMERLRAFTRR